MIIVVTYDLRAPGRNYQPLWAYLSSFTHCKGMESVYLLDTNSSPATIRDNINKLIDSNDRSFVARLSREWASWNYGCADWLKDSARTW